MRESPRERRLRSDFRALFELRAESSIFDFVFPATSCDRPPEEYLVRFHGRSLWRNSDRQDVRAGDCHEVQIRLGASYPRQMPDLVWRTPIFHPNISTNGLVCLGGYSHHWVPSLSLDALCVMLWDMLRFQNYDVLSPYNREAASWLNFQHQFTLPTDRRPLRDRPATAPGEARLAAAVPALDSRLASRRIIPGGSSVASLYLDAEVVEAEIVPAPAAARSPAEIVFLDGS